MTAYRIVCVTKEVRKPHARREHIVIVGVTTDVTKAMRDLTMTVGKVRERMNGGDQFFTVGPDSGKRAAVRKLTCGKCGVKTIRSRKDAVVDNNLDGLASC
ncbi:MAG TPA: hypothetical protein VNF73_02210 [Candidatus Saccharimonadales bacterium]|nr:hypothetical protein [Candidatus Saccharimonadales bacterium]